MKFDFWNPTKKLKFLNSEKIEILKNKIWKSKFWKMNFDFWSSEK